MFIYYVCKYYNIGAYKLQPSIISAAYDEDNDTCTGHGYYNVCKIIRSNKCNLTYQYRSIAIYIHLNPNHHIAIIIIIVIKSSLLS